MSTFKDTFNPTLDTLIKSFSYLAENESIPMDSIPLCRHAGYKWLWGMKEQGWLRIERSNNDGRSHLASLTIEGAIVLEHLRMIKASKDIFCHKCGADVYRNYKTEIYKCSNCDFQRGSGYDFDIFDPMIKRRWTFTFEDENFVKHDYPDDGKYFIGNNEEAIWEAKRLSNEWEKKTGMWCFLIIRNSHGVVN